MTVLIEADVSWQDKAGCKGHPANLFFIDSPNGVNKPYRQTLEKARQVCANCPVVSECYNYAVQAKEQYGVWGGVDFQVRGKKNRSRACREQLFEAQRKAMLEMVTQ